MFWKRLSIWFLVLTFSVMMAAPSFALAAPRLSTASNSNYYSIQPFTSNMPLAASAYDSPVYARVGNSFTRLQYDSTMSYITVPANADCLRWDVSGSYALFVEPVDSSNLNMFYQIQEKHMEDGSAHWSTYNVSDFKNGNSIQIGAEGELSIYLMMSNVSMSTKMKVLMYPTSNFSSLKVKIGGVYDTNDKQVYFSNQLGGRYLRCVGPPVNSKYSVFRFPSGGLLKKGYEYTFTFYAEYAGHYVYTDQWGSNGVVRDGKYYTFTINPTRDMDLSEIPFCVMYDDSVKYTGTWYYVSSSSSYIPASDTGQQGQVTAANTTVIKNIVTNINNTISNIQNTVSNISTQITNATTTITNTITNKVDQLQSSISSGLNNLGSTITGNADKNTDKITQSQKENTNKVIENQDKNTDKVTANQDKNTDTIVNGYDSSAIEAENDRLSSKLEEFEKAEDEVIGQISNPLAEFEFHNPIVQYLSTFQLFGNFMQDVFTGSGAFKDVINMSFIMSIALLVAGLYRFKGGN